MGKSPEGSERAPKRIIAAALKEFEIHGIDGARIDGIIKRAQVSKQLFYYYFKSKEEVYQITLESVAEWAIERILAQNCDGMSASEGLASYFRLVFDQYAELPMMAKSTTDQDHYSGAHISRRNKLRSLTPALVAKVGGLLKRGVASGEFRSGIDVEFFYAATTIMLRGCFVSSSTAAMVEGLHLDQRESLIRWRENCIQMALDSIRHPDCPRPSDAPTGSPANANLH